MTSQSIEATLQSIEATSQSIEATWQSIALTLQSIEAALQSIDDSYSLIETACSFCEEKWTFSDQAFPFSEENLSSIENEWKFPKQNTHSIEDADKLVETRCPVVDEEWSPVDANGSSASTKWNPISIDCSLAPIHCLFASIVCQVSSIASSFVGRRFRLHTQSTPESSVRDSSRTVCGRLGPPSPARASSTWGSRETCLRKATVRCVPKPTGCGAAASKSPKRVADGNAGVARGRRSQVATYRREMIGSHWKGVLFERLQAATRARAKAQRERAAWRRRKERIARGKYDAELRLALGGPRRRTGARVRSFLAVSRTAEFTPR